MVRTLTTDELIYINEQIPVSAPIHKILKGKQKVRDAVLLEAAAGRPLLSAFGQDAYPTLPTKAAALLHSIARNHPFADGNKRTATVAALFMLEVNGLRVKWDAEEALARILDVAEGRASVAEFAAWLPTEPGDPPRDADADADMAAIRRIISDHAALLRALAER